jgi:hypothetical protein
MSVWLRGAIFERTWYAGQEVGAAVEACFCALSDKEWWGRSGRVVEDGGESLWIRTGWLYWHFHFCIVYGYRRDYGSVPSWGAWLMCTEYCTVLYFVCLDVCLICMR